MLKTENCILRNLYINLYHECSKNNVSNWLSEVRTLLISIGMNEVWRKQTVENEKLFLLIAKQNLKDLAYQKIDSYLTIQISA